MAETNETVIASVAEVVRLLSRSRVDLSTEKHMQAGIEEIFLAKSFDFEREKRLSPTDIPDFVLAGGLVVECKVRGARKMDIFRQLTRYASHDSVKSIILASNITMGLPVEISGKPIYAVSMARGWV